MQVKASQAVDMIMLYLKAGLVPLLVGNPGIGKSNIYQQIADDFRLLLIDMRLSTADLVDLTGFPLIVNNKGSYVPMDTFPIEGDKIPDGYNGWLILFDEITSAKPALQAASYKILLDRKVGQHKLHKNVALCAAGNLETDGAVVYPMSTALQSRLVHMELIFNLEDWMTWANINRIDSRITGFLNFDPQSAFTFKPDHTDSTYACPRTWAFVDRILKVTEPGYEHLLPMLAGTISEGVARQFMAFCKIESQLPKLQEILKNPAGIAVPTELSIKHAITSSLSEHISVTNATEIMQYISRFPIEFQVICVKAAGQRNKKIHTHPSVKQWVKTNMIECF